MDDALSEMIQDAIDALALAQIQIGNVMAMMRRHSVNLGPEYASLEGDMTRILDDLTYMKYLAERRDA